MNKDKQLVRLIDVPKHITVEEICREISSIMNFSYLGAKDLAGIVMRDSEKKATKFNDFFVYFLLMSNINLFKERCKTEDRKLWLYIFNEKIQVRFPSRENFWNLSSLETHNREENLKELRVATNKYQTVTDVLDKLPYYLKNASPTAKITSIVQAKSATFIQFSNPEDADRAKRVLSRKEYECRFATSYTFVCNERNDEAESNAVNFQASTSRNIQQPIHARLDQNRTAKVTLSAHPPLTEGKNKSITIGVVNMNILNSLFEPTDNIYMSLQTIEEPTLDHNTVVLNEDVNMSD